MPGQRLRKRRAAFNFVFEGGNHPGKGFVFRLPGQEVKRLHDGQAGVNHGRQLTGKNDDISLCDLLPEARNADFRLKPPAFGADTVRERTDTAQAQTGRHRRRVRGVHFTLDGFPVRSDSLPAKDGHNKGRMVAQM